MTRLIQVELRRFFARRLTRLAGLGMVALLGLLLVNVHQQVAGNTPARVQQRISEQQQSCQDAQTHARASDPSANFGCDQISQHIQGAAAGFAATTLDTVSQFAPVLAMGAFLIGAGFVAAEFSTGSLSTWLTFEPRRRRVYGSKIAAVAVGMLPLSGLVLLLLVVAVYATTRSYDLVGQVSGGQRRDLVSATARVIVIASAAGVGGAVLGALLRHTAAALGLALAYFILVEGVFSRLITRFVPDSKPWLVVPNFNAWVRNGITYPIDTPCMSSPGPTRTADPHHHPRPRRRLPRRPGRRRRQHRRLDFHPPRRHLTE